MRKTTLAILFVSLATFASQAHAQDCKLVRMASLDMSTNSDGNILIPVMIENTPQKMIVSPASGMGEVNPKLVDALGIKTDLLSSASSRNPSLRYSTMYLNNGEHAKRFAIIDSMTIGMVHVSYTDFIVNPYLSDDGGTVAGSIGYDILKNFDLDFDFAGNKLNLFSPDHCPGKVVYWATAYTDADMRITSAGAVGVTLALDGQAVDATLAPESLVTTMTLTEAHAAYGIDEHSPGVEAVANPGGGPLYRVHFKTLSLSGITVKNPLVYLEPDAVGRRSQMDQRESQLSSYQSSVPVTEPHLIVGLDVLRHLHLYIAYKEQKIYATAADVTPPTPPAK
jgi:hypothetical protein